MFINIRRTLSFYVTRMQHLLLLLAAMACLAGCHRPDKIYRIGVSQCSDDEWRNKVNEEIRREAMLHDNVEVEIRSVSDNTADQIADIEYFAKNGFDLLIVAPNESGPLTPVIEKVYEGGMPVIIFDREIASDKYTALIEGDNNGLGVAAARYARARSGNHNLRFLELTGLLNSTPATKRHEGFAAEIASMPDAEITASVDGRWNREPAEHLTDSILRLHPEINVIYAHNDIMAIGASKAARELNRNDIMIIGIDGTPEVGISAVADSVIDATFVYPTDGYRLIRRALEILTGSPFNREEIIPSTSAVDSTNADLLLQQSRQFNEETNNIPILNSRLQDVRSRHNDQTLYLYLTIAAILILLALLYQVVMSLRRRRRLHAVVEEQNHQLAAERDKQKDLYRRLELATQSKLTFFTNISHDLRTPLTLISEPVQRLANAQYLKPEDRQLMRIANKNISVLRRLINQILDFRKYENGRLELNLTEIDPGAMLREWCQSFIPLAEQRGINLFIDTEGATGHSMAVDTEKLERILFNLMSNAFRHTGRDGSIKVTATFAYDKLVLKLADTGCGIPAEEIPKIFERFHQVPKSKRSDVASAGSGIGLAVVKAFVELHEGSIDVDSTVGQGSVFTVTIPVHHIPAQADSKSEAAAVTSDPVTELEILPKELPEKTAADDADDDASGSRPLLLLIEDNIDMQQLISIALADTYDIITASDGATGVRLARKYIPDIVISDVMMPEMDGFQCCAAIKSEVSTSHIPVLLLTACAFDEQRITGYEEGADSYLAKPFNSEVLRARCRNLLDNRLRIKDAMGVSPMILTPRRSSGQIPGAANIASEAGMDDLDSDFYRRFLSIVEKNLGNSELGINDIASQLGLGHSQLGRKIKSLTGQPPVSLIRSIRLHRARTLLLTTDKSISEIAYEVGFTSPAYFSKSYLEQFGNTPTSTRTPVL